MNSVSMNKCHGCGLFVWPAQWCDTCLSETAMWQQAVGTQFDDPPPIEVVLPEPEPLRLNGTPGEVWGTWIAVTVPPPPRTFCSLLCAEYDLLPADFLGTGFLPTGWFDDEPMPAPKNRIKARTTEAQDVEKALKGLIADGTLTDAIVKEAVEVMARAQQEQFTKTFAALATTVPPPPPLTPVAACSWRNAYTGTPCQGADGHSGLHYYH